MNRREHLLTILQEECSEIIQCVSKVKRFGIANTQPASGKINLEILNDEFNDLLGMIEMLNQDGVPIYRDEEKIQAKMDKVEHYLKVSQQAGRLNS